MKYILLFTCFFLLPAINAQELFFGSLPVFPNLPSIETYHVFQDSKGFMWITSDGGLSRYDGNTLTNYTVKDGISENIVFKGYEDRKGRVWFTTLSGYFFYYYNNQFHSIAANPELKKLCLSHTIITFFIGENDTLYCSSLKDAALLKIPAEQNYKNIIKVTKGYENCNRFCYQNKLNLSEGVLGRGEIPGNISGNINYSGKIITANYKPQRLYGAKSDRGGFDKQGNAYLGLSEQLIVIRKATNHVEYYEFPNKILSVYQDKNSDLWVGTEKGGGYLYRHSDLTTKPIIFLSTLSISSIFVDREHVVWVSTLEKGVFKSNNKEILLLNVKGLYFQKNTDQLNITGGRKTVSIFKNDSQYIDNSFSKFLHAKPELRSSFIGPNYSYFNDGLSLFCRVKKDTNSFSTIVHCNSNEILELNKDTLYMVSPKGCVIVFKNKAINKIFPPFAIGCCTKLKDKKILLASRSNDGIFELKNGAFIPYLGHLPQLKTRINSMVQDSAGNLWVATNEKGLYCYGIDKKLYSYNVVTSDKLNFLTLDSRSNLWITTNRELIKINYSKNIQHPLIYKFNQDNGIPNFQLGKLVEFNGKIWCATSEKLFYFDSEKLMPNTILPFIYVNHILVNDKPITRMTDLLNLKYDENTIRIQSASTANKNIAQKQFQYRLMGYDTDWHFSSSGDIQYMNLPYGKYEFMIYGLNNDNLKSSCPATFSFQIKKPFWLTWWFILLEATLLFMVIYFYFRYWKNKIEKREHDKVIINQRMAEFKMTALRSQMNPHFIFNAIGSIQHYILKNEIKQSYDYLSKFSILIRNILNNSRQEYIFLAREISTLQLYIELEQLRFTEPFQFKIEIDEQLDMDMDIPTMLIQPYVENSIWHGLMPKKSGGLLELVFKKEGDSLLVIIRDNGVGRQFKDPGKKHVSKGMSITEQRIEVLETTNKQKFKTTIIDLKDEKGAPAGTEINLIIPFDYSTH